MSAASLTATDATAPARQLEVLAQAQAQLADLDPKPFVLPLGALAPVVAGAVSAMAKGDWLVTGPRERIGAVLRGCSVARLVDATTGARPYKLAPVSGSPGHRALHAVGLALGSQQPVLCFLGLASAATGAVHEAMNTAVLTGAPVIFLYARQRLGPDAPVGTQLAGDLADIALAHGLQTEAIDLGAASGQSAAAAAAAAAATATATATATAAVTAARGRVVAGVPQLVICDLA